MLTHLKAEDMRIRSSQMCTNASGCSWTWDHTFNQTGWGSFQCNEDIWRVVNCQLWGLKNPGKLVDNPCCYVVTNNGSGILVWKDPRVWARTDLGWEDTITYHEIYNVNWEKTAVEIGKDGCPSVEAILKFGSQNSKKGNITCSPPEIPGRCPEVHASPKFGLAPEGEPLPALVGVSVQHSHMVVRVDQIMWPEKCSGFPELEKSIHTLVKTMLKRLPLCHKPGSVRQRRDVLSDVAAWVGVTGSMTNAITMSIDSNNRDWAENLLASGTISVAKGGSLTNQATRHLASATHYTGEVITVILNHLVTSHKMYKQAMVDQISHARLEEMCYRSGMEFSIEVTALIGDLLASRVPGWVRETVIAHQGSEPWVIAGEGSLSVIGICQDGSTIRGGLLIPVGHRPVLKAQPIHPLPFPCQGHLCQIQNVRYIVTDGIIQKTFSKDQCSILGGWVLCTTSFQSGQALGTTTSPDISVKVLAEMKGAIAVRTNSTTWCGFGPVFCWQTVCDT